MAARHATIDDLPSEFCEVAAGATQEALDLTQPLVSFATGGQCDLIASELHAALASHWLTLNGKTKGTGEGMVKPYSREIDKLEVGAVGAAAFLLPFSLRRTRWGELYLALKGAYCIPSLMVV